MVVLGSRNNDNRIMTIARFKMRSVQVTLDSLTSDICTATDATLQQAASFGPELYGMLAL